MRTASLFYKYDSVLRHLQVLLARRDWIVLSVNKNDGTIKAHSKGNLFHRAKALNIKIETIDRNITNVTLRVNSDATTLTKTVKDDELAEEKLIHTIEKFF